MIYARFGLALSGFTLDVNLQIPSQGITALFGSSGSGKTTLLRCFAGLEKAVGGLLRVDDEVWQEEGKFIPAHQRGLGYVSQEANLFPHLSVRENLEYGYNRIAANRRRVKFEQAVRVMGLWELLGRDTAYLSGGERQRVAIARSLLTSPRLLLMDEPLSALDTASKREIFPYLEKMHRELEIPVIYVSHTLDEVARLADHLILMEGGRVIGSGALGEMLSRLDMPTAHLDDAGAVIDSVVAAHDKDYHLMRLDFPGGSLWVDEAERDIGSVVRIRVQARAVSISVAVPQASSIVNVIAARIVEIKDEGAGRLSVRMAIADKQMLLSRITRRSGDQLGLTVGMEVFAQVKSVALIA